MISRNLYFNLIVRILLIVILSVTLGYLIFSTGSFRLSFICLIIIIILTANLISYFNSINRKIRFFFDSVKNDDSNLFFPVDEKNSTLREISNSMNRVNLQIKQLKIENSHQEQYFETLLEHLATGIITYDSKGFILHINSPAKKLLSVDILTHLQQIERIDPALFHSIKSIRPSERRLVGFNTPEGEIELSLKATSIKTPDNELVILSIQDIKNELDEKELESWMKLIRILMHEIMNSITPITSLSQSLSGIYFPDGHPLEPEKVTDKTIATTLQGLNVIKEQGKGLITFVDSYRKLTRVPEPVKKLFRISELLERIQVLYNSLEGSGQIGLSLSIKDPDLEIFADQNLISQVLINLLKNALEANENNASGRIGITSGSGNALHPEICVEDNGPGIPKEHLDKIFVPFFTTRQNGSGIGLSISKQIMRIHGGTLKVKSEPGHNTIFCMSFRT
jgi:two-component system nitrogen regulation sensor histidine kinase NtrY